MTAELETLAMCLRCVVASGLVMMAWLLYEVFTAPRAPKDGEE